MEYKRIDKNNYTLHLINSNRFKTISVVVYLTKEFDECDIKYSTMLSSNLVYTTKKYNTKNKIAKKGEELYGTSVYSSFGICGALEEFCFAIDFLNPKYTEESYLYESVDFLCECLFNPNVKDGKFDEQVFEILKKESILSYKAIKDNPGKYASIEFAKIMYKGTPNSYNAIPTIEDIESITPSSLYNFYKKIFSNEYKMSIVVLGEFDGNLVNYIDKKFEHVKCKNRSLSFKVYHKYNKEVIEKTDMLHFNQSRLYMGYRLNNLTDHEMYHVLKVYNTILGTMNDSILFNVVRENNSLCYSIGSYTNTFNPSLIIYAGINKNNYESSVILIKECMELMKDKNTLEKLFTSSIKTINTYINNYYDDATSQVNRYYNSEFESIESIEELRENINKVTIEEVIDLNNKISLSTIYLLKGDN